MMAGGKKTGEKTMRNGCIPTGWRMRQTQRMSRALFSLLLLATAVVPVGAADPATVQGMATVGQRLIPHYGAGGFWTTRVRVMNPTPSPQTYRLSSYNTDGAAQTLLYDGTNATQKQATIPAFGVSDTVLYSNDGLKTGLMSVEFLSDPRLKLPVTMFMRVVEPYNTEGAVSWDSAAGLLSSFVQFDNTSGGQTGVAVADLTPLPATGNPRVEMNCFSDAGGQLGTVTALTAGKQQNAFDLGTVMGATAGFKGLCTFKYMADGVTPQDWMLSVLALQFKGVNFLPLK